MKHLEGAERSTYSSRPAYRLLRSQRGLTRVALALAFLGASSALVCNPGETAVRAQISTHPLGDRSWNYGNPDDLGLPTEFDNNPENRNIVRTGKVK